MPPLTVQELILEEVRQLRAETREEIAALRTATSAMQVDLAKLKMRSGVWGALAGLLPALGVALWVVLKNL